MAEHMQAREATMVSVITIPEEGKQAPVHQEMPSVLTGACPQYICWKDN